MVMPGEGNIHGSSMMIGEEYLLRGHLYKMDHLECFAQILQTKSASLATFVGDIDMVVIRRSTILLSCKVDVDFEARQWDSVVKLISGNAFPEKEHKLLRDMWDQAHYMLYEEERGKFPQEVQRFRIRKKNPYPKTIWNGDHYKYLFAVKDREILEAFYDENKRPSRQDKEELSRKTNLTIAQVSTWFKNRRNRHKDVNDSSDDTPEMTTDTEEENEPPKKKPKGAKNPKNK